MLIVEDGIVFAKKHKITLIAKLQKMFRVEAGTYGNKNKY